MHGRERGAADAQDPGWGGLWGDLPHSSPGSRLRHGASPSATALFAFPLALDSDGCSWDGLRGFSKLSSMLGVWSHHTLCPVTPTIVPRECCPAQSTLGSLQGVSLHEPLGPGGPGIGGTVDRTLWGLLVYMQPKYVFLRVLLGPWSLSEGSLIGQWHISVTHVLI